MEVAGSSRPASGSEHLISHAYDELAPTPSLHGLQVGVATLATTWLQGNPAHDTVLRVLEETGFAAHLAENRLDRAAFVEAVQVAPTIKPGYHTVLSRPGARIGCSRTWRRPVLGRLPRLTASPSASSSPFTARELLAREEAQLALARLCAEPVPDARPPRR